MIIPEMLHCIYLCVYSDYVYDRRAANGALRPELEVAEGVNNVIFSDPLKIDLRFNN